MRFFWGVMESVKLRSVWVLCVVSLLSVVSACKDCPDCEQCPAVNEYAEINDWILENMEVYYFWNEQIPGNTDKTLEPSAYFESLLSKEDRFSWIQDNSTELVNSLAGVNTEAGYEFYIFRISGADDFDWIGCVTYIKPGSPAESENIQRGDFFLKINGILMQDSNVFDLLAQISQPHTITKAFFSENTIYERETISFRVVEYKENPIFLDTIYTVNNKKIGYFVYNFFAQDNGDGSLSYEKELNNLFGKFKTNAADELIVDLRYNGGGTVSTSIALASMISNCNSTQLFGTETYNPYLHGVYQQWYGKDYNKIYFVNSLERYSNGQVVERIPINQLGLKRVYLIVSDFTASASELIINGLKPYMEVILVGETTVGKNVGSYSIYEDDPVKQKKNSWGMQPIVLKYENSLGFSDYVNGFTPDIKLHELDDNFVLKPLGETDELLLSTTIKYIFGETSAKRKSATPTYEIVGSSADRNPARQNMYIKLPSLPSEKR